MTTTRPEPEPESTVTGFGAGIAHTLRSSGGTGLEIILEQPKPDANRDDGTGSPVGGDA